MNCPRLKDIDKTTRQAFLTTDCKEGNTMYDSNNPSTSQYTIMFTNSVSNVLFYSILQKHSQNIMTVISENHHHLV